MKHPFFPVTFSNQKSTIIYLSTFALILFSMLFVSSSVAESGASATFALTASSSGPGSISPSGSIDVPEGARQSFVFNSDTNHRIVDVIVDGISVGPIDAFSFENISGSHTIQAIFDTDDTDSLSAGL